MDDLNDQCLILLQQAFMLEAECFSDMTLEDYPAITSVIDEWGDLREIPSMENVSRFYDLNDSDDECIDEDTLGAYNRKDMSIGIRLKSGKPVPTVLAHEMIHSYEHQLENLNPALKEYVLVRLYSRLSRDIPDLEARMEQHLEVTEHRSIENGGGRHGLLFLLKSYDIDLKMGEPLGTVFGYGEHAS